MTAQIRTHAATALVALRLSLYPKGIGMSALSMLRYGPGGRAATLANPRPGSWRPGAEEHACRLALRSPACLPDRAARAAHLAAQLLGRGRGVGVGARADRGRPRPAPGLLLGVPVPAAPSCETASPCAAALLHAERGRLHPPHSASASPQAMPSQREPGDVIGCDANLAQVRPDTYDPYVRELSCTGLLSFAARQYCPLKDLKRKAAVRPHRAVPPGLGAHLKHGALGGGDL